MIETLLHKGSAVDGEDAKGLSPLQFACIEGFTAAVEMFVFHGAMVNKTGPKGKTAVCFAEEQGHHDVLRVLLANGGQINVKDEYGTTPFGLYILLKTIN